MNKIELTQTESSIFECLLSIRAHLGLTTTFRVAGGWVRDKLMGLQSDDLDIALDNMTGLELITKMRTLDLKQFPLVDPASIYVIQANPDKSKHLETVAITIAGLKIDLVNLRDESYGTDSRVPTMDMVFDPAIDAERRDLTINAMFYNVHTQSVEDYVGGLCDLQWGVLRPPLNPMQTFLDDPLRALRTLRFLSRFPEFHISAETRNVMFDPLIHEAYLTKVSPERAGVELVKLMNGVAAPFAIRLLFESGLYKVVLSGDKTSQLEPLDLPQRNAHHSFTVMEHTLRVVEGIHSVCQQFMISPSDRAILLWSAIFHDWGKCWPGLAQPKKSDPTQYNFIMHEGRSEELVYDVMMGLGIDPAIRKVVGKIVRLHMDPHQKEWSKKSMGRFLHAARVKGNPRTDIWKLVVLHSIADLMGKHEEVNEGEINARIALLHSLADYQNVMGELIYTPLVNGDDLQSMFPTLPLKPPAGQSENFISWITQRVLNQQWEGRLTTKEEALKSALSLGKSWAKNNGIVIENVNSKKVAIKDQATLDSIAQSVRSAFNNCDR